MKGRADWRGVAVVTSALGLCAALLWYFHNRFWWPVDDGVYAYVAQRINAGDVMHRDLVDLHAGYVNLLHALAFRIFGEDLLSLRYPLAGLTLIQAALAAALLWPKGPWQAAAAALVVTAFSFIQFLNPSANWYALFLFFVTVWVLTRVDTARAPGAILIGFLIGLCFLFRQLSGVFLAMGVLTWLLVRPSAGEERGILARVVLAVMALGLGGYLWSKGSLVGFLLIGLWPLAFLIVSMRSVRRPDAVVAVLLVRLSIGACLAAAPLVIYHLIEGSLGIWLNDIVFAAFLIHGQDFIAQASFLILIIGGLLGLTNWTEPSVLLNGVLWLGLTFAPLLLGVLVLKAGEARNATAILSYPLPLMACFFALVALHYQIPIYLFFAIAPVLIALLFAGRTVSSRLVPSILVFSAVIAVVYQAGQPVSRGLDGIVRGHRVALDASDGLPRARVRMERADQDVYRRLIDRIESTALPSEALFALPMDPELNFLTKRPAPVPYYGTPLGLRQAADVDETMARLEKAAPMFVVVRRDDKYLTPFSRDLLARIRRQDPVPEPYGPFDLYRLPAQPAVGAVPTARE
jgi:hypothetical protein